MTNDNNQTDKKHIQTSQNKIYQWKSQDLSPRPRRLHELTDLPAPQDLVQDEQLDSPVNAMKVTHFNFKLFL